MKYFLSLLLLVFTSIALAQTNPPETLTNVKIVTMVKGGLPKAAIISSIQNKPTSFDTSTDGMIALKKQGVPDDIITAMASKVEKVATPQPTASIAAPPKATDDKHEYAVISKSKECNVVTSKNNVGQSVTMVESPTKQGNFLIAKEDGKIVLIYNTKMLMAMILTDTKNVALFKIDSVQFVFDNNSIVSIKPTVSRGTVPNNNHDLKPVLTNAQYNLTIPETNEAQFRKFKLKGFRVIAERDAQYADLLNDKQQDKLLQSFNCIP